MRLAGQCRRTRLNSDVRPRAKPCCSGRAASSPASSTQQRACSCLHSWSAEAHRAAASRTFASAASRNARRSSVGWWLALRASVLRRAVRGWGPRYSKGSSWRLACGACSNKAVFGMLRARCSPKPPAQRPKNTRGLTGRSRRHATALAREPRLFMMRLAGQCRRVRLTSNVRPRSPLHWSPHEPTSVSTCRRHGLGCICTLAGTGSRASM